GIIANLNLTLHGCENLRSRLAGICPMRRSSIIYAWAFTPATFGAISLPLMTEQLSCGDIAPQMKFGFGLFINPGNPTEVKFIRTSLQWRWPCGKAALFTAWKCGSNNPMEIATSPGLRLT